MIIIKDIKNIIINKIAYDTNSDIANPFNKSILNINFITLYNKPNPLNNIPIISNSERKGLDI